MPGDDEASFDAFVTSAGRRLLRAAWLLTSDWQAAEDLVQTALEKTWPHWPTLQDAAHRLAYTRRVMTTTYLRAARRRWNGEIATQPLPEIAVDGGFEDAVLATSLRSAITRLPPKQRACVVLRYFLDLSEVDTASAMSSSVGAVKSNTARGLDTLRRNPAIVGLLEATAAATPRGSIRARGTTEKSDEEQR